MTCINPFLLCFILVFGTVTPSCRATAPEEPVPANQEIPESEFSFEFNTETTRPVSELLMGFNVIYPHEKNSIWQDGKIAGYLKDVNVGFIRYPGGTVCSYYHWNGLTGEGWKDSWDPVNFVTPKPASEFMDIDEYMALVRTTGATPLVGINMSSGWRWNRQQDGLNEAIALMQYCKDKNFDVKYWYLDNEPYQEDSNGGAKTPEEYGELINTYVPVMKAFKPGIKIIVNWNSGYRNKRAEHERLLKKAGHNIDIMDVHWYWSWSDTSWEKYASKTPMTDWTGYTYSSDIAFYKNFMKNFGYPHIEMASLEWNTGPIKVGNSLTASRAAYVQTEMMMQFIEGGLDYAVFWPIHWPDEASKSRSLVNTSSNMYNPNYLMFKFLGQMQGGRVIPTPVTKSAENQITLAVHDPVKDVLRVCILNKNQKDLITDIDMKKFPGMKIGEARRYMANSDGSHYSHDSLVPLQAGNETVFRFLSKSFSITMLTFVKP